MWVARVSELLMAHSTRLQARALAACLTAAAAAVLACASPASAGTAHVGSSNLGTIVGYDAPPGEANDLRVWQVGETYYFDDSAGVSVVGCDQVSATRAACAGPFVNVEINLDDGANRANVDLPDSDVTI